LRTVWLSCGGENVGDEENLPDGNISYKPVRGIPGFFFPYKNQPNYKSPFVMVQLDVPPTSRKQKRKKMIFMDNTTQIEACTKLMYF